MVEEALSKLLKDKSSVFLKSVPLAQGSLPSAARKKPSTVAETMLPQSVAALKHFFVKRRETSSQSSQALIAFGRPLKLL
jgi:hypothetical protein